MCTNIYKTFTGKNIFINDRSRLESISIKKIVRVQDKTALKKTIIECSKRNTKISILGTQHSQGGQSIYDNAIALDMNYYNRILKLDIDNNLITVQSGITWEKIQNHINEVITIIENYIDFKEAYIKEKGDDYAPTFEFTVNESKQLELSSVKDCIFKDYYNSSDGSTLLISDESFRN